MYVHIYVHDDVYTKALSFVLPNRSEVDEIQHTYIYHEHMWVYIHNIRICVHIYVNYDIHPKVHRVLNRFEVDKNL